MTCDSDLRLKLPGLTVPGKVQSYLAAGRPIVAMLDGEGARVVTEARAGFASAAGDPHALAANILRVLILILITFHLGDGAGQSFLHVFAGMTLFATALLLLLGFDALLRRLPALRGPGAPA